MAKDFGSTRGPSDMTAIHPGMRIKSAGNQTQVRVARDSWSTTRAIMSGPESPGRTGRHRGPSDTSVIHPGELVEPEGTRTQEQVARDCWLSTLALGPKRE